MRSLFVALFCCFSFSAMTQQPPEIPLYRKAIPGAKASADLEKAETGSDGIVRVARISRPTLRIYSPDPANRNDIAILIFPGGGYAINAIKHEGWDVAEYLRSQGFTAVVVKYRLPDSATMEHPEMGPLQDAQEALMYVRKHAKKLGINPAKTGVMGFSAGGHLASTLSTHFVYHKKPASVRPDFSILVYPVITLSSPAAHTGSRDRLLGKHPTPENLTRFSNELQVTPETPPAFLIHAKDDRVSIENTYLYRDALQKNGVTVETLIYEKGGHGYGMHNRQSDIFWPSKVVEWLKQAPLLCL